MSDTVYVTPQPKVYLAAPYSHPDAGVRNDRAELASMAAAELMQTGYSVFSPVSQGHQIAYHLPPEYLLDTKFWMAQCLPQLKSCDLMYILPLEGWRESRGVRAEIALAMSSGIPVLIWENGRALPCNNALFNFHFPA